MYMYWLIDKVLSGKATQAEKDELDRWINEKASNKIEFEDMKLLWEYSATHQPEDKADPRFYDGLYKIKALIARRDALKPVAKDWKFYISLIALVLSIIALVYCCVSFTKSDDRKVLRFENRSLAEVVRVLKENYGIEIVCTNPDLLNCRFTGTFYEALDKEILVKTLSNSLKLHYRIESPGKFTISGIGCIE